MKKAIILLNMGAARSEKELRQFLFNMFMDKRIIDSPIRYLLAPYIALTRTKKVWKNYELIGGSRLYDITESLSKKLSKETGLPVYYAMRYTTPRLHQILRELDEAILLPMYPQYSTTTVESSLDELKKIAFQGKLTIIPPFYNDLDFNRMIAHDIRKKITRPAEHHLIFSAHGLPQEIIDKGDPYEKQLQEQIAILQKELTGFKSIRLAFQSRFGNKPWLQPYLEDTLKQLKGEKVVVYPISFMIDNSETDLELKIEYAEKAKNLGLKDHQVISCPNDNLEIVSYLNQIIQNYVSH